MTTIPKLSSLKFFSVVESFHSTTINESLVCQKTKKGHDYSESIALLGTALVWTADSKLKPLGSMHDNVKRKATRISPCDFSKYPSFD